jgi:hypothetical protein
VELCEIAAETHEMLKKRFMKMRLSSTHCLKWFEKSRRREDLEDDLKIWWPSSAPYPETVVNIG